MKTFTVAAVLPVVTIWIPFNIFNGLLKFSTVGDVETVEVDMAFTKIKGIPRSSIVIVLAAPATLTQIAIDEI